jgi:hypothetical protein
MGTLHLFTGRSAKGSSPEDLLSDAQIDRTNLETSLDVHAIVDSVDEDSTDAADSKEKPSRLTLGQFVAQLEAETETNPTTMDRLRRMNAVLLFVAAKAEVPIEELKDKVYVESLPGMEVGRAIAPFSIVDPTVLDKEDLENLKHVLLHEHVMHVKKGITEKQEGLAEFGVVLMIGGKPHDYFDLVMNVRIIIDAIGEGDLNKGFDIAVELCKNKKYSELFDKFEPLYNAKHPSADKDTAYKIFQLAFPYVHNEAGEFEEDVVGVQEEEEAIDRGDYV